MSLNPPEKCFNFLFLPREIRDLVYTSLLKSESPPKEVHELKHTTTIFPFFQLDTRFIHLPPQEGSWANVQNLLASNSQVRTELVAKLSRPGSRCQLKYHLQCTVVRDVELFPQWRSVPAPVCYMQEQTFQLDVKLVGGVQRETRTPGSVKSQWMNSAFKILELIEEFFNRGPTFRRVSVIREDVKVQTVLVNVLKPSTMPEDEITKKLKKRRPRRLPDGSLHPMAMYDMLVSHRESFKRILQGRAQLLQIRYDDNVSEHKIEQLKRRSVV